MFGIEKKVQRVREALVQALRHKSVQIMQQHQGKPVESIPKHDLARGMILMDLAEVLVSLRIIDHPDDHKG